MYKYFDFHACKSPVALVLAGSVVYSFAKRKYSNSIINWIGGHTFAVLLISDHNDFRDILWKELFPNSMVASTSGLIVHMLSSCTLVFFCCVIIDTIVDKTGHWIGTKLDYRRLLRI